MSRTARRAGWIGCNILLNSIPESGKIFYVKNNSPQNKDKIIEDWNRTTFLGTTNNIQSRGWILDIMICIEKINKQNFTLHDLYQFESFLSLKYPKNNNIKAKIRQQLQILRDKNFLKFEGRGKYILQ